MARDPPNRVDDIFQAVVVFTAAIAIALMAAALFLLNAGYFVLFFFGVISLYFFAVGFLLCLTAFREHDGEAVETSQEGNQQRDSIQLPAIAIAQLRQLPPAEADGATDAGGGSDNEGVVCLGKVGDDGPATRKLTACRHVFHKQCIEQWLRADPTCPICRCDARQESLEVIVRLNTK